MRLSVVVPAYNVQDHVAATLESLSRQNPPVYEVIVVDDGSTDETAEVVARTVSLHPLPRFQLLQHPNRGVSVARNIGLSSASGDYVLFLDGDDVVSEQLTSALLEDSCNWPEWPDVVCWKYRRQQEPPDNSVESIDEVMPGWSSGPETLRRMIVIGSQRWAMHSMAWRIERLRQLEVVFMPGCEAGQDTEFRWRAMSQARQVRNVDRVLSTYVWRAASTTNSPSLKHFDGFLAYHRATEALCATLGDEYRDVVQAASRRSAERFMGHFIIHSRTYPGGSRLLLHDLEARQPGIIKTAQQVIRGQGEMGSLDPKWRLFLMSPSLAGRYFESEWSQSNPSGLLGLPIKGVRHARHRSLGSAVRARTRALRADLGLRRAAARVRRQGPSDSSLAALALEWGNVAYSADLQYLSEVTQRGLRASSILECGSGLTTLALGALGRDVWTLEHDRAWFKRLLHVLRTTGARRVRARYAPLQEYGDLDWYSVPTDLPARFDLVICDGPPGRTRGGRSGLFRVLAQRIEDATVLLDDVHRPAEQALLQQLAEEGWSYEMRGTVAKRYAVLFRSEPADDSGRLI